MSVHCVWIRADAVGHKCKFISSVRITIPMARCIVFSTEQVRYVSTNFRLLPGIVRGHGRSRCAWWDLIGLACPSRRVPSFLFFFFSVQAGGGQAGTGVVFTRLAHGGTQPREFLDLSCFSAPPSRRGLLFWKYFLVIVVPRAIAQTHIKQYL